MLTDLHGEIIIKEAFDGSRTTFDYDTQAYAYQEVQRLLDSAIVLLRRTDGAVDSTYVLRGDHIYNGSRSKWLKLAWGLKALVLNHFSNQASYDPATVMAAVDSSFTSNADDALPTLRAMLQDRRQPYTRSHTAACLGHTGTAAKPAWATAGFDVSIEIGTRAAGEPAEASSLTTGKMRRSSSASSTPCE